MTRDRIFGEDTPFMAWVRAEKRLPSNSANFGFVATDVDACFHVHKTCVDAIGTRQIQSIIFLEVKTRGGDVGYSQGKTLSKINLFSGRRKIGDELVWFCGVACLKLSGQSPVDSSVMEWGRFRGEKLIWRPITTDVLVDVLRFDLSPDTLLPQPFRRHHKRRELLLQEETPLGFKVFRRIRKMS